MPAPVGFAPLGAGLFLGWGLGSNDAANCFGTAVGAGILPWRRAAMLCAALVVVGAVLQGGEGIDTLSGLSDQTIPTAAVISMAAAVTVAAMTFLRIPISTSQAVVGAILGVGLATDQTRYEGLTKVLLCWVGTPLGAMLITIVAFKLTGFILRHTHISLLTRDKLLWGGLILVGCYGSYALGANNVANTTGIFSGLYPNVTDRHLAAIGGVAMAAGVLTFSRRVMLNVGKGVMTLDAFTAFVAVLSMSVTVHIFAMVGVPVSTSQGIVGSVIGIGMLRGTQGLRFTALRYILLGWFFTPAVALILAAAGHAIFL